MTGDRPDTPENNMPPPSSGGDAQTLILEEIRRIARAQERMENRLDDRLTRLERRLDDFEAVADGTESTVSGTGSAEEAGAAPGSLAAVTAGAPRAGTAAPAGASDVRFGPPRDSAPPRDGGGRGAERTGRTRRGLGTVLAWFVVLIAVLATAGWWAQTTGRLAPLTERVRGFLVAEEAPPVPAEPVAGETVDETPDAADAGQGAAVPAPTERDIATGVAEETDVASPPQVVAEDPAVAGSDATERAVSEEPDPAPSQEAAQPSGDQAPEDTAASPDEPAGEPDAGASAPSDGALEETPATATAPGAGEEPVEGQGPPAGAEGETQPADGAAAQPEEAPPRLASTRPAATPQPPPGQPEVAAVPPEPVESADLEQVAASRAPLPNDASDDLRELASLALEGRPEAQHDLATAYALGEAVPRDYELAAYWYRRSADSGVANALYNLGVLTERGLGVEQDSAAAFDLFLAAAEEGHPDAQNAVGLAYSAGRGVEQDLFKAASWFQAASASGNPRGAFHMGRLFERGLDGAPDANAAAGWYRIAVQAGDADAEAALARLTGSGDAAGSDGVEGAADPAAGDTAVPVPDSTPEPVASGPAAPAEDPLTQAEIEQLQRLLNESGYDAGPVDGLMGDQTRSAIEAWQQDNGLPRTGEPSRRLLERLRSG